MKGTIQKTIKPLSRFAGALMLVASFLFTGCPDKVTVKPEMFAVTFSAGEHGTVKATVDSKPITSGGVVQKDKTVTFTAQANAGYDVEKWTVNSTTVENTTTASYSRKITAKTEVKVFFKPSGDTRYTVKHFKEKVTGGYDGVQAEIETLAGTTGKNTEATAKTYTGFIAPATVDQKPIAADGSTVIEIKYARKEITLTFELNGGNINGKTDSVTVKGKYEAAVTKPTDLKKVGYTFSGWNPKLHNKFPAEDATYTAQWAREGDYTITYNLNDGTDNGGNPASYNVETETITLKPAGRTGYDFIGWYEKADFSSSPVTQIVKGSTGNKVFWAKWEPKTDTKYTVRHLQEGLDGKYGEVEADRQTLKGTTGNNTEATAKTYTGFITPTVDQEPIAADGSTVIEIKYARKEITFTFNLAGGNINGKMDSVTVTGKYEEAVTKPANPTKTGYTFSDWKPELLKTFPAQDATYTAQWQINTHKVTFEANSNGTLTATLDGEPFNGGNVAEGKTVEFTAKQADDYMVGKWHVAGSSFIAGTGLDGSTTAGVKITANTHVTVSFVPLPGKYISVPFGENGKNLDNYLKTANAASDGIYYIEVTDLAASDLKGVSWNDPSPLGKVLKANEPKKVALKLGAITGLTDMSWCFYRCTSLVQAPGIPSSVTNMEECFERCTSLTQAPMIPSSVTAMSFCFYCCTSLRSVTLKCNYLPNTAYMQHSRDAFKYCSNLSENSIKVPADQLSAYQGGASTMGTRADRFFAE